MIRRKSAAVILSALGFVSLLGCAEKTLYTVAELPTEASGGVLTYYLPRTDITVQVTEKTVTHSKGRFYPAAHLLRGSRPDISDPCAWATALYVLADAAAKPAAEVKAKSDCPKARPAESAIASVAGVSIGAATRVDARQAFAISIPDAKALTKTGVSFEFTPEGVATGGTAEMENKTVETIVAGLKATASVIGAAFGVGGEKSAVEAAAAEAKKDDGTDKSTKAFVNEIKSKAGTPEDLAAAVFDGLVKDPCLFSLAHPNAEAVLKSENLSASEVCEAFYRLGVVKKKRDALLDDPSKSGDGGSFASALKSLEEERDSLLSLFKTKKTETTRTFPVNIPEEKIGQEVCVPRASTKEHLVPGDAIDCPATAPAPTTTFKPAPHVRLKVELDAGVKSVETCKVREDGGLVYRLPASGIVRASWAEGRMQSTARVTLPQFGRCIQAPNKVKGKNSKLVAKISKETGMLTTFEFEQSLDYSDELQKTGEAIKDVTSAIKERSDEKKAEKKSEREKEEAENDLLSQKKRELELLELQRKIDCLSDTGKPCPEEDEEEKEGEE